MRNSYGVDGVVPDMHFRGKNLEKIWVETQLGRVSVWLRVRPEIYL